MKHSNASLLNSLYTLLGSTLKRLSQWRYVLILAIANVFSIVRLFAYAKIIPVEEFGSYATLVLISSIFIFLGPLGFLTELQKKLPIYFKDKDSFKSLISILQALVIVFSVFFVISVIALFDISMLNTSRSLLLAGIFGGLCQLLFTIITSETRARQFLIRFSNEILVKNIVSVIVGLTLAFYTNQALWIFLTESIATIVVALILFGRFLPELKQHGFFRMLKNSLTEFTRLNWHSIMSLFAIGLLAFAMQNGERYFAKSILSIHSFAILSFGLIIPNIASTIQSILNSTIFTNQILRFNEQGRDAVVRYSIRVTLIFVSLFSCISLPMYFITREAISIYYPKYIETLPYLPLIFLAFIMRSSDFISNIYVVINKAHYIVIIQSVYILLVFLLSIELSKNSLNLTSPLYYFGLNFANALVPILIMLITIRIKK